MEPLLKAGYGAAKPPMAAAKRQPATKAKHMMVTILRNILRRRLFQMGCRRPMFFISINHFFFRVV
jgi:hypothetical protein